MNIIAVTACPTGIAHSQMAAENLENAGEAMGHEIHVEVQGAMGTENEISEELIASADAVIVAADTTVRTDRFGDVPVVKGSVKDAVNDAEAMVREAEEIAGASGGAEPGTATDEVTDAGAGDQPATGTGGETEARDEAAATGGASGSGGRGDGERDRQGIVGKLKSLFS